MRKKLFILFAVLLLLVLASVYIFIPGKLSVSVVGMVNCNNNGALRVIWDEKNWTKWWPGTIIAKSDSSTADAPVFIINDHHFKLGGRSFTGIEVEITHDSSVTKTMLSVMTFSRDSSVLQWESIPIVSTGNPFTRIGRYIEAKDLRKNISVVLEALSGYLQKKENVYGMAVKKERVKDSILISTRFTTASYPGTTEIYTIIQKLKNYIAAQGATENNFPMMNVLRLDSNHYETMIAIPVNKELRGTSDMAVKRMVLGFILEAEVKGGTATVRKASAELENFRADYQMATPAIPFELLVTDRSKEPDTGKWITRVYYPVF